MIYSRSFHDAMQQKQQLVTTWKCQNVQSLSVGISTTAETI
jgi:hypothetical protein